MTRALQLVLAGALCGAALAGPLSVRTRELPSAIISRNYDAAVDIITDGRCPDGNVGLTLVAGALPRGVELRNDGLHGTPLEMGSFQFTLRAVNGCTEAAADLTLLVTGRPILRVDPQELVVEYVAGGPAPPPMTILVSSTWPRMPYSIRNAAPPWVNVSQEAGMTPSLDSAQSGDLVHIRVMPQALEPGYYRTELVFSAWQGANAPVVPVILKVVSGQ